MKVILLLTVKVCVCLIVLAYLLLIYSGMESSEEFSDTDQLLEESQQTLPTPISGSDPLEHNEAGEVKFEEMSISDVVSFLRRNNIPSEFCGKFRGQSILN